MTYNLISVHDPESPGGGVGKTATLGSLRGFENDGPLFEMVDGASYNGDKGKSEMFLKKSSSCGY